jgi:hypothetical protein
LGVGREIVQPTKPGSEKVKAAELAHLMFFPADFAAHLMPRAINGLAGQFRRVFVQCGDIAEIARGLAELALVSLPSSVGLCRVMSCIALAGLA